MYYGLITGVLAENASYSEYPCVSLGEKIIVATTTGEDLHMVESATHDDETDVKSGVVDPDADIRNDRGLRSAYEEAHAFVDVMDRERDADLSKEPTEVPENGSENGSETEGEK